VWESGCWRFVAFTTAVSAMPAAFFVVVLLLTAVRTGVDRYGPQQNCFVIALVVVMFLLRMWIL